MCDLIAFFKKQGKEMEGYTPNYWDWLSQEDGIYKKIGETVHFFFSSSVFWIVKEYMCCLGDQRKAIFLLEASNSFIKHWQSGNSQLR